MASNRATWFPVAVLSIAMLSFQMGASLAKGVFPLVGAAGLTSLRLIFGAMIMGVGFRVWRFDFRCISWRPLLVFGASLGTMNFLYYQSLRLLPLGIAVTLEFTGPLAVAIWTSRRLIDLPWVVLAIAGLLCLLPLHGAAPLDPLGVAFALGAGACWALYIVYGQKSGMEFGIKSVALGAIIAAMVVAPFGLIDAGARIFSWHVVSTAIAISVLSTALPHSLEMFALTRLTARTFSILMSLEPALGCVAGWLFLHETLSILQVLGVVAIVFASAGTTLTSVQARAAPAPD